MYILCVSLLIVCANLGAERKLTSKSTESGELGGFFNKERVCHALKSSLFIHAGWGWGIAGGEQRRKQIFFFLENGKLRIFSSSIPEKKVDSIKTKQSLSFVHSRNM